MRILELSLHPFRNFGKVQLRFEADRILISGPNGCGKSNLLEGISYLSIGRSVRGARDHQAVPRGGQHFDVRGVCDSGRQPRDLRLFFARQTGKRAFCNGTQLPHVSEILGIFRTAHFSPEDVSLVLRFPAQRRRLLDILISQSDPQYLHDLQRYQRVLTQRNRLLRGYDAGPAAPSSAGSLESWTAQLAYFGARLREKRLLVLASLKRAFAAYSQRFSLGHEKTELVYQGAPAEGKQEDALATELAAHRNQEQKAGYTLCGPHRDDLGFLLNGQPADVYASEGQLKTILIAWKMAEVRFLQELDGDQPVLLLDDVFSELDEDRTREVLESIGEFEQVLATTPRPLHRSIGERFAEIRLS